MCIRDSIHTDQETPAESAQRILSYLEERGYIPVGEAAFA